MGLTRGRGILRPGRVAALLAALALVAAFTAIYLAFADKDRAEDRRVAFLEAQSDIRYHQEVVLTSLRLLSATLDMQWYLRFEGEVGLIGRAIGEANRIAPSDAARLILAEVAEAAQILEAEGRRAVALAEAGDGAGATAVVEGAVYDRAMRAFATGLMDALALVDQEMSAAREAAGARLQATIAITIAVLAILGEGYRRLSLRDVRRQAQALDAALTAARDENARRQHLVNVLGHEFRTPLAVVKMSLDRLRRRRDRSSPEDILDAVARGKANIDRLLNVLDAILGAARQRAGTFRIEAESVDLHRLIGELVADQEIIAPNHAVALAYDGPEEPVTCARFVVVQVVTNLLSNAVKYSPGAERVDLRVRLAGDRLAIEVQDYGIGIPEEDQPKIFGGFYRASNAGEIAGNGIGLPFIKGLCTELGGTLTFVSREGAGSTFRATMRIGDAAAPDMPAVA